MVKEKTRVLIAENQWVVREGLKSLFTKGNDSFEVEEASSPEIFEIHLANFNPNVVLLDFSENETANIDLVSLTTKKNPSCKTIVFSNNLNQSFIFEMVSKGAIGFISKKCEDFEILSAVNAASKGNKYFCGEVLNIMLQKKFWSHQNGKDDFLSEREIEVLSWICKGFTNKEVADKLFLSVHTINTHRKNIMRKMEVKSSAELISSAIKKGLVT